jgi:hypothetical protein
MSSIQAGSGCFAKGLVTRWAFRRNSWPPGVFVTYGDNKQTALTLLWKDETLVTFPLRMRAGIVAKLRTPKDQSFQTWQFRSLPSRAHP